MYSIYLDNCRSLEWYSTISNIHFNELLRVSPKKPNSYKGLIFLGSTPELKNINASIKNSLGLVQGKMSILGTDSRWIPIAREAGYKRVFLCADQNTRFSHCNMKSLKILNKTMTKQNQGGTSLYQALGEIDGYLVISLNITTNIKQLTKDWTQRNQAKSILHNLREFKQPFKQPF